MNRSSQLQALAWALLVNMLLPGCATHPPVRELAFDAELPSVAAQYRTSIRERHTPTYTTAWRLRRRPDRIERENLDERTGEWWQRDGATMFHTKLFHADKRGIEFQPGDLAMVGAVPRWTQQSWIINPELLNQLSNVSSGRRNGYDYRRYKGTVGDAHWDITLRLDVMLPQAIERQQGHRVERIELSEVHPLAQAPWQPTPSDDYGMIDFADIGDHERDPFIQRLHAQSGGGHVHAH